MAAKTIAEKDGRKKAQRSFGMFIVGGAYRRAGEQEIRIYNLVPLCG
jgi:hypothetical protein